VTAQLLLEWKQSHKFEQTVLKASRLSAATALSTEKKPALENLGNFYRLMQKNMGPEGRPGNLSPSEIDQRLDAVNSALTPN
jgi:hypothetical protein